MTGETRYLDTIERLVGRMSQTRRASFIVQTYGISGASIFAARQQVSRTRRSKLTLWEAIKAAPRNKFQILGHNTSKVGCRRTCSQVMPCTGVKKKERLVGRIK
jgi:hypothetical protein